MMAPLVNPSPPLPNTPWDDGRALSRVSFPSHPLTPFIAASDLHASAVPVPQRPIYGSSIRERSSTYFPKLRNVIQSP